MATKTKSDELVAQNPLILRAHRLMEAFAKSDDERDFYLDRLEGFIIYVDLDKPFVEISALEKALKQEPGRYCLIPKLSFYETKKIMEGFVNEKVYDIDTKEKLLDIISSKAARDNFLEFIYDHHSEQEKWQQYYQERSRIRIIEWLRKNHFQFVFEEDLDLTRNVLDKLKTSLFEKKVNKDIENARKVLLTKAKTYYSNEALNPRPKRGRPPKQVAKQELEPQVSSDLYTTVPAEVRPFLFTPQISHSWLATFSSRFESEEQLLAGRKTSGQTELNLSLENLTRKLESLRQISDRLSEKGLMKPEEALTAASKPAVAPKPLFEGKAPLIIQQKESKVRKPEPKPTPKSKVMAKPASKLKAIKKSGVKAVPKATKKIAASKKKVVAKPAKAVKKPLSKKRSTAKR